MDEETRLFCSYRQQA